MHAGKYQRLVALDRHPNQEPSEMKYYRHRGTYNTSDEPSEARRRQENTFTTHAQPGYLRVDKYQQTGAYTRVCVREESSQPFFDGQETTNRPIYMDTSTKFSPSHYTTNLPAPTLSGMPLSLLVLVSSWGSGGNMSRCCRPVLSPSTCRFRCRSSFRRMAFLLWSPTAISCISSWACLVSSI